MTLQEVIYNALLASEDLFELVGDNIYYENPPPNFDFRQNVVIYSTRRTDSLQDLSGEQWGETYVCTSDSMSPEALTYLKIADAVEDALYGQLGFGYNFGRTERDLQGKDVDLDVYRVESTTVIDYIPEIEPPAPVEPPVASNVQITGVLREFEFITATYDYFDPGGFPEEGTLLRWRISNQPGGGQEVYIPFDNINPLPVPPIAVGLYIRAEVTPRNNRGVEGETAISDWEGPVLDNLPPSVSNVRLNFATSPVNQLVGEVVVCLYDYFDPEGDAPAIPQGFEWFQADDALGTNEEEIVALRGLQYGLIPAEAENKFVRCEVTPIDQFQQRGDPGSSIYEGPIAAPPPPSTYSPEADDAIARYANLTDAEKDSISVFVDIEVGLEHWGTNAANYTDSLYDVFWVFALGTEADALQDMHQVNKKTAVNNGAAIFIPGIGFSFNGLDQWLASGYVPSVDSVNYLLNDAQVAFYKVSSALSGLKAAITSESAGATALISIFEDSNGRLLVYNNDFTGANTNEIVATPSLIVNTRTEAENVTVYDNGVALTLTAQRTPTNVPTKEVAIGGNPSTGTQRWEGILSSALLGAAIGFDQNAHYNNLVRFLEDLAVASVLDRYANLTADEEAAIEKYVRAEYAAGNHSLKDEEFFLFLTDGADSLTGAFSKTATNNGATHLPGEGYDFDGASGWMESNWNPTNDASNYQLNDGMIGVYVHSNRKTPGILQYIINDAPSNRVDLRQESTPDLRGAINGDIRALTGGDTVFENESLYTLARTASNLQTLYKNGVSNASNTRASTTLGNEFVQIGRLGNGNSGFFDGVLSTLIFSGAANFDQTAHYTNLTELLIDVGFFVNPILARYSNLTQAEIDGLTKYINNEVRAGNHQFKDEEFFLFLTDPGDSLIGAFSKTATNNGAVHVPGEGYDFDGLTQYIDSEFNPSVDGDSYQLNDAQYSSYIRSHNYIANRWLGGAEDGSNQLRFQNGTSENNLAVSVNDGSSQQAGVSGYADTLFALIRRSSTDKRVLANGADLESWVTASTGIPNLNFFIGCRNQGGTPNQFAEASISTVQMGGALPDQAAHYANLLQLLIDVDFFAGPVIARYSNLTTAEEDGIRAYVNAEVLAGNHLLKDEEFFLFLTDPGDSLTGAFSKTATNNGAVHVPGEGYDFDGISQYIDSNFNPSTDGVKYQLDDAMMGGYLKANDAGTNSQVYFGANVGALVSEVQSATTVLRYRLNATGTIEDPNSVGLVGHHVTTRTSSQNQEMFIDGVSVATAASASSNVSNANVFIGARGDSGVSSLYFDGTISTYMAGAAIGLDQAAHYTNLLQLLIDVDFFAGPVIARYSNLTTTEEDALRAFINAEVLAGNFGKYDEFYPLFLSDPGDSLIGFFSKTAVNNGAVQVPGEGYSFDGVSQYIDSDIDLSTLGGLFSQNDGMIGAFINSWGTNGDFDSVWGSNIDNGRNQMFTESNNYAGRINATSYDQAGGFPIASKKLIVTSRTASNLTTFYENAVSILAPARASAAIGSGNLYIGAQNGAGGATGFADCELSTLMIGAGIGFNQTAHYTNLVNLLTAVGVLP